ncbi:MAG: hypothetical protein Kow0079_11850 [Vicingaceae bacterium]
MSSTITIKEAFEKSLFLLGAGFSYDTGCLTSNQMFDDLRKIILGKEQSDFTDIEKETLRFLLANMGYHSEWRTLETAGEMSFSPNIEELVLLIRRIANRDHLVPYSITGNWADKLIQLEAKYEASKQKDEPGLFHSLLFKFRNLLKEKWLKIDKEKLNYLSPLLGLLKDTADTPFSIDIFSLNNDLVIETYFSKEQQIPWRGFVQGQWKGLEREPNEEQFGRINLYKLHGSIDWVRPSDYTIWEESKLGMEVYSEEYDLKIIKEQTKKDPFVHYPYLIFGQGTKTFSAEPFFTLINHFHKALKSEEKKYIFVIGYSFFDPYINNLLFDAAKEDKRLIIINPYLGPQKLYQKYQDENNDNQHKPKPNPDNYFQVEFPEGCDQSNLIDYLKNIQKNNFYSELPEFNQLDIRGQNLNYIPLQTDEFLEKFFTNSGNLFTSFIDHFDRKNKEDLPFKDD